MRFIFDGGSIRAAVPHQSSGEMATGLLGKHVMMFAETPALATQYQLRPLAVFSEKRLDTHLTVPTAMEGGFNVRGTAWGGLVAPKGLSADTRSKLAGACAKATASVAYRAGSTRLNSPLVYRDATTFAAFAASEAKAYSTAFENLGWTRSKRVDRHRRILRERESRFIDTL